jgi:flagellar biogenesis protein FliO
VATIDLNKEELAKRRKFMLLCGVGAAVVILGMIVPRMLAPTPEASPSTKNDAFAKASPQGSDKAAPPLKKSTSDLDSPNKTADVPEAPGLGSILTRLVGGTLVVLVLCGLSAYGIGRWLKGKNVVAPHGPLKIVAALRLNSRCSVILLQAGDQHIIAGMDASGLKSMLHLPAGIGEQDEDTDPPRAEEAPPTPPSPSETVPAPFTVRAPNLRMPEPPMHRVDLSGNG